MRKQLGATLCGAVALTIGLAAGSTAAGGSSSATTATTAGARKGALSGGNLKIDKAGANVNSLAGFLTVLKDHQAALSAMESCPLGPLAATHERLLAAQSAISSGNANALNNPPRRRWGCRHVLRSRRKRRPSARILRNRQGNCFCTGFLPILQAVGDAIYAAGSWPLWRPTRRRSPSWRPKYRGCRVQSSLGHCAGHEGPNGNNAKQRRFNKGEREWRRRGRALQWAKPS